ncbi:WD repeat-containing protein [Ceratobasidium sp. AG-Ba]|nr:WD repeat-containing protein [Ceratobasidium sp. AG-Ba]
MASERKHFKRLKRFHHGVFGGEESSQGTSTPGQSLSSPQPTNADLQSVEPESVPPAAALALPPSSNPATASAHLPAAEPPVDTPMQAPQLEQTYTANSRAVTARDNTQAIKRKGWNGLKQFAGVLSKTPDVFGPLKHAADVLVSFIDTFETAAENRTEWQQLKSELDGLFEDLREHMDASVPPMMTKSIENLERGIKKETDFIEQIQKRSDIDRYLSAGKGVDEVLNCYRRIKDLFRRLSLNANIDTWKKLDELATYTYLKGLPNSEAAYYRSADSIKLNRTGCTENTRVGVLRDIYNWARGQWPQKIYWLNGMAGTGKTTIAYSLCKLLEEEKMLAASFFCSRQLPECRNVNRIVPTIAYQLSNYSSPFRHVISPLLQTDMSVYNKPILEQLQELIIEPINKVKDSLPTDLIIVIDALDECEAETGTADILDVLLAHASSLPLRFFVSSRPDEAIITRMRETQADGVNTEMRLHELASDIVQADIRTYLRTKLESCMSISEDKIDTLVEISGVLFIYASTVVRYVSSASVVKRAKRLEEVLDMSTRNSNESTQGIDALYISILSAAYDSERLNKSDRAEMMLVLHTVVCACEPLSTSAMADLLNLDSEQTVQSILVPLLSVLQMSESGVITTLHESFRDFLLQDTRSDRFHCNAIEHNGRLAELCFRQIGKQVPFNICGLESSYVLDKDVHDLSERVDRIITKALFYACCYWDVHMSLTDSSGSLAEQLVRFLSQRLLLWMEIMNLKNAFLQGIKILYNMKEWSRKTSAVGKEHGALLEDGWKFMSTHSSESVLLSTPHLYVSALLFWPDESPMRRYYESKGRNMIGEKSTAMGQRNTRPVHTMSNGSSVNCVAYSPNGEHIAVALDNSKIHIWSAHTGKQIGQPLQGHTNSVTSVAYSHDSAYIVSGSDDKTVRIWDAHTGEQIGQPLQGHTNWVRSVAYSHDSAYIVSGSDDNTVRIWDAHTGEQIGQPLQGHTSSVNSVAYSHDSAYIVSGSEGNTIGQPLRGHTFSVNSVAYSHDGAYIVSGSDDNTVRIWDAHTGEQIGRPLQGHTYSVRSVAYSHDSAYIVSGSDDNTVRIWDAHTGEQIGQPLQGHTSSVNSVAYSHDSAYIVSGSEGNTVRIWDAHTGEQIGQPLRGHTFSVNSVAYSHDGAYIVSGSDDNTVRIWDAHTGEQIGRPLQGHTYSVRSVAYSHDSAYIVSGSDDNTVRIWDAHTGEQIGQPLQGHTFSVNSVAYSHDGAYIVSGSDDNTVRIWDAHTGEQIGRPLQGHTYSVRSVAYSHDSAYIVSGSDDNTVRIWDAHTGEQIGQPLQGHTNSVTSVAYSHDSAYIVSGSEDKTVRIWDAHTGEQIGQPLQGHTNWVNSVAYSQDSAYIVSGSEDKTVRIWDAHTGEQIGQPLQGHTNWVNSVAYSQDSAYIVSGSEDNTVRIWDAHTGEQIGQPLQGHTYSVISVAYPHDSAYIVSGSEDNTVRIWDAHTGEQIGQPLQGHTNWVISVAYSHDSAYIVSGSGDRTVRIWNAHTGEQIGQPLQGHTNWVTSVAYSHDSAYIVSGSEDKTVRIWDAHTGEQIGQPLQGHTSSVKSVAYSHDSAYIVSGSSDYTVRIWDAHTGEQIGQPLQGHTYSVTSVACSDGSAYITSGSEDTTVRCWESSLGDSARADLFKPESRHNVSHLCTSFCKLQGQHQSWILSDNGWVVLPGGELLLWIPSDLRPTLLSPRNAITGLNISILQMIRGYALRLPGFREIVAMPNLLAATMVTMDDDERMMDVEDVPRRVKRFTFRSYEAQLKDVHAPSEASPLTSEQYIEDTQSHFQVSLKQWRQLNLSPCFISFANQVDSLSGSLAMVLHRWQEIVALWVQAVSSTDEASLKPLIELSTCIVYDLRQTPLPVATKVLSTLLSLLSRKLASDVLELLLAALTTHLKRLVLPNSTTLLDSAWNDFPSAIELNEAHVRMLAEVWGHLVRKLKKEGGKRAVKLLVEHEGKFGVWCLVEATRAKHAQGIYTTATDLIGPLVDLHIDGKGRETSRLTRRVLTALIHHSKVESFAGVAGVVVEKVETEVARVENKEVEGEERLIRAMEVATVMCAVRKGGKLTTATVSTLLPLVPRMMAILKPRPETRAFVVATLAAGDMSVWIGPGRRALDAVWQDPIEGMRIAAILSELGWGGWKSMVLPYVLRRTPETHTTSPTQTLSILAHLYSAGKLDVDPLWVARVGSEVSDMLGNWDVEDDLNCLMVYITKLLNILALAPMLPNAVSGVSRIVGLLDTQSEKDVKPLDAGLVEVVEKWSWSESVMDALVEIQPLLDPVSLDTLLRHLLTPLTPHSRVLRSSVLQILPVLLSILASENAWSKLAKSLQEEQEVWRVWCFDGLLPNQRSTSGHSGRPRPKTSEYLLAKLYGKLYSESWRVCKEPGSFALRAPGEGVDEREKMDIDKGEGKAEWREEEKTWRCPSASGLLKTVAKWEKNKIVASENPESLDRLDLANYETLLTLAWEPESSLPILRPTLLYTTTLSHPDRPLQSLALTCLLTFKEPHVLAVEQSLRMFLDETEWRDEMMGFNFDSVDESGIEVIIRLLFVTMLERNRRDRKSAVLTLLAGCSAPELKTFVRFILALFEDAFQVTWRALLRPQGASNEPGIGPQALGDLLKHLGREWLAQRQAIIIRQTGLKRLVDSFPSASVNMLNFLPYVTAAFQWFISPRDLLAREHSTAIGDCGAVIHVVPGRKGCALLDPIQPRSHISDLQLLDGSASIPPDLELPNPQRLALHSADLEELPVLAEDGSSDVFALVLQ